MVRDRLPFRDRLALGLLRSGLVVVALGMLALEASLWGELLAEFDREEILPLVGTGLLLLGILVAGVGFAMTVASSCYVEQGVRLDPVISRSEASPRVLAALEHRRSRMMPALRCAAVVLLVALACWVTAGVLDGRAAGRWGVTGVFVFAWGMILLRYGLTMGIRPAEQP